MNGSECISRSKWDGKSDVCYLLCQSLITHQSQKLTMKNTSTSNKRKFQSIRRQFIIVQLQCSCPWKRRTSKKNAKIYSQIWRFIMMVIFFFFQNLNMAEIARNLLYYSVKLKICNTPKKSFNVISNHQSDYTVNLWINYSIT